MKIYLQTADNLMEREHQDLLDLYKRYGIPRNSPLFQDIAHVVKFSEFRELARRTIPEFETWLAANQLQLDSENRKLRLAYKDKRHHLTMLREAVNPECRENTERFWAHYALMWGDGRQLSGSDFLRACLLE